MRCVRVVLAISLIIPAAEVSGRQLPPIAIGERVRLTHSCAPTKRLGYGRPVESCRKDAGTLATITADSVVLEQSDEPAASILLGSVRALEVAQGRHGHALRGAPIGLAVGAGSGVLLGALSPSCDPGSSGCLSNGDAAKILGYLLAVPGFVIGAFIGACRRTDRWVQVPTERLRVNLTPQRSGLGLGLSVPL